MGFYFNSTGNEIAENNADDVLLGSGSTKIYQSSYQNGNWSVPETLAEDTAALPEFAAGFQNGIRHIAYAKEGELYIDGEKYGPGREGGPCDLCGREFLFPYGWTAVPLRRGRQQTDRDHVQCGLPDCGYRCILDRTG